MTTPLPQNYANRLRPEVERLVFRLRSSWLLELELNVLPEPEPKLSLSCSKALAPAELGDMEASSDMSVLATEFSPDSIPCTIAWTSSEVSAWVARVAELVMLVVPLELAPAEDTEFRALESRASRSR